MNTLLASTLVLALAGTALAQPAASAPKAAPGGVPMAELGQPAAETPKSKPLYDESADARQQIGAALAAAKKNNRRVLIQWGGNWCPWCIRMGKLMKSDKQVSHELLYEYDVVHVDCGRPAGKNVDLAEGYGAEIRKYGFPYLTILDSSGKMIANQETDSLEVKNAKGESVGVDAGHDPAKVLEFLKKYEAKPIEAKTIYDQGLADAKTSNKAVFLHFGAPWCVWCHRLEDWMARPDVAPVLAKSFVDVKIDQDRNTGGKEMLDSLSHGASGGIPWFVFLDSTGKPLADSNAASGNIGYPGEPAEIEHFASMLKKANVSQADIDTLVASLKETKTASATH